MSPVWKFPFEVKDHVFAIEMPEGAEILSLQVQRDVPAIWAFIPKPRAPKIERSFWICVTGGSCPPGKYIGTFQLAGGQFVGHLFEVTR